MKYHCNIVKNQIGTGLLHGYVKSTEKYKDSNVSATIKTKMVQDSFEELCAYIVLKGCDKAKYKSLVKGFVNQFSLKNDQYPKTVQDMTDALSKHAFDDEYHKRQRNKAEQRRQSAKNRNNNGKSNNSNNHKKTMTMRRSGR